MEQTDEIVNRVTSSSLVTVNLEEYYPQGERTVLDIKPWLYQEVMLKEKEFRESVKMHDWSQYKGHYVAIVCSADAIVPTWAYMLVAAKLEEYAKLMVFGSESELEKIVFKEALKKMDPENFRDKKVVIKGCGDKRITEFAYVEVVRILKPVVSSIMYGEPCSTVPIFKAKRK